MRIKYYGRSFRRCSLRKCEQPAEFIDQDRKCFYCKMHAEILLCSAHFMADYEREGSKVALPEEIELDIDQELKRREQERDKNG